MNSEDSYAEVWALVDDGRVLSLDWGIGKVYGLEFDLLRVAMKSIEEYVFDADVSVPPFEHGLAWWRIGNIKGDAAENYWEMDVEFDRWEEAED